MKKIIFILFAIAFSSLNIKAQEPFKVSNGNNVLEIGGIVSSYVNLRDYPAGVTPKLKNNTFKLKDARLDLNGKFGKDFDMHIQLDFGSIGATYDPASPLLNDANITYKGLKKLFNIRFGYGKLPYSLNSFVDHEWAPYWERPLVTKGDFFSRRDIGLRLDRSFWKDRIKAFAGMYTGTGELSLIGENDPSGDFEYIGRVELGYPERKKDYELAVDTKVSSTPNIQIGINGRYANKRLPDGSSFILGEAGALVDDPYNFKVVNGKKVLLGADVAFLYKGFSLQAEAHSLKGTLKNPNDPLLFNTGASGNNYFKAFGWFACGNYYLKPAKSIFSVRYEQLDANDLIPGSGTRVAYSYCYQIKGFHSMIRAEMYNILTQTEFINNSSWKNQFRIGWQFVIE